MALKEVGHIFRGAVKATITMTDSKSVSGFFLTKTIPPQLCNACDCLIQCNFVIAHFLGNLTPQQIFHQDLRPTRLRKLPKKREDKIIKPTEVNIESTGIAPEEPVLETGDDQTKISEKEIWQRKFDLRITKCSQLPVIAMASVNHIDLPNEPSLVDTAHFNELQEY